jgi:hypothetical protein
VAADWVVLITSGVLVSCRARACVDIGGAGSEPESMATLESLRGSWGTDLPKGQIVISDGLEIASLHRRGSSVQPVTMARLAGSQRPTHGVWFGGGNPSRL